VTTLLARRSQYHQSVLGIFGSKEARADELKPAGATASKPGTNTSFGPLKQINAGVLNIGYAEAGPVGGLAVRAANRNRKLEN
jgi:hypothetical protein